ncbi:MAG: GTPase [Burkholderiaceae bacterium]|nr:GTPase [Burkholderiaceae bacterium]
MSPGVSAPDAPPTLLTLVTGGTGSAREAAIAAALTPATSTATSAAIIAEGIASGTGPLDTHLRLHRIAPGCMCCIGNLTLRVTLNRILRNPPQRIFISLATDTHLPQLQKFLASAPYDGLLSLTDPIICSD